ncbi:hypothetical protein CGMCC3_g13643 [Colletotrichum fructicola]|nr:uncharacterized protein CGMCC3_g13643 [Colletotrichum fructicola]KAE9570252.1 hypothetical protein CGMCC3_g13643 [Colletotrichum fructicola]
MVARQTSPAERVQSSATGIDIGIRIGIGLPMDLT